MPGLVPGIHVFLSVSKTSRGSPGQALRDSHIVPKPPAVKHGFERLQPVYHDDGARLAVVARPPAEARAHPASICQRSFGMRVLLFLGLALEGLTDCLQRRLVFRIERIL